MVALWSRRFNMAPNECIEFPENPLYTEIPLPAPRPEDAVGAARPADGFVGARGLSASPPFRLVHVYPQGSRDLGRALTPREMFGSGPPVLFVPGHKGSFNQSKASAAQAFAEARQQRGKGNRGAGDGDIRLTFFAVDTLELNTGLSASQLWAQTLFVNRCVRHILHLYGLEATRRREEEEMGAAAAAGADDGDGRPPIESVVLLAHSMGGVAARAAAFAPNHVRGTIGAIVTLNSPHRSHPVGGDAEFARLYAEVNRLWTAPASWAAGGELANVVVASIAGGSRDKVVRGDLTRVAGLAPPERALHAWSTALPGVWIEMDHDAIVWCGQLVAVLSRAIISMHEEEAGGYDDGFAGRLIADPVSRLSAFRESLLGNRRGQWDIDLGVGAGENDGNGKKKKKKKAPTVIPASAMHAFVGKRARQRARTAAEIGGEGGGLLPQVNVADSGMCIPLPRGVGNDERRSLAIVTDVAPFRSVRVSACADMCTRGRTDASGWGPGRASCRTLEGIGAKSAVTPAGASAPNSRVLVLPHSRRRRHLHHSYDPLMDFGRQRHHHRWSRVTAADLIDEARYVHSGSVHVIVVPPSQLWSLSSSSSSTNDAEEEQAKSVHIYFEDREAENDASGGSRMPPPSQPQQQQRIIYDGTDGRHRESEGDAITGQVDWFLQTQLFHDSDDLWLPISTASLSDNAACARDSWSDWISATLWEDVWRIPLAHTWVVDLDTCSIPYSRFSPQTLTVERGKCVDKMPTRIGATSAGNNNPASVTEQDTQKDTYRTQFFAPIVRFQIGVASRPEEEIISTPPPHATAGDADFEPDVSVFHLTGHDFDHSASEIRLQLFVDPRCSYTVRRRTHWARLPEQFMLGYSVLWMPVSCQVVTSFLFFPFFSPARLITCPLLVLCFPMQAYHAMLLLLLSAQLASLALSAGGNGAAFAPGGMKAGGRIPSLWSLAVRFGIPLAVLLALVSWATRDRGSSSSPLLGIPLAAQEDLWFVSTPTMAVPDATRSLVLDLGSCLTALAAVVFVNGSIVELIVILRLTRIGMCRLVCASDSRGGRGRAPGCWDNAAVPRWCRRCLYRRSRAVMSRSLLQVLIGSSGGSGGSGCESDGVRGRANSDVHIPDVEDDPDGNVVSSEGGHVEGRWRRGARFVLSCMQGGVAVGLFWLCPLVVLMVCTLFMITKSAVVYPELHAVPDNDEDNDEDNDKDDEESPGIPVRLSAREKGGGGGGAVVRPLKSWVSRLMSQYSDMRARFMDGRSPAAYALTCAQFHFSLMFVRAPAVLVAVERFAPSN